MKYKVFTPGPVLNIEAPNLEEALYQSRRFFRLKKGWYIRLATEGSGRKQVGFLRVYNSRNRLVTGASIRRDR